MEHKSVFTNYDSHELVALLSNCLVETFKGLNLNNQKDLENETQIFNRKETAEMLKISLPTLNSYTQKGFIKSLRIGNSVRYRFEDIIQSLKHSSKGRISGE